MPRTVLCAARILPRAELPSPGQSSQGPSTGAAAGSPQNGTSPTGSTTTTTSPTGNAQTTEIAHPPPGVNLEGAVGIAMGCLVAGILIGLAAMILFHRRRTYGTRRRAPEAPVARQLPVQAQTPQKLLPWHKDMFELGPFLLDSSSDKDIAGMLDEAGQLIEQHVENNYHAKPVSTSPHELTKALQGLGVEGVDGKGSSVSAATLTSLALESGTRRLALRHLLSLVIFSSMDLDRIRRQKIPGHPPSILPAPMVAFVQAQPGPGLYENREATARAATQWRVLAAYLMNGKRCDRTALEADPEALKAQAAALAQALDAVLAPFARPGQVENLVAVILESARLGYVLVSQPNDWRFEHSRSGGGSSSGGGNENGKKVDAGGLELVVCAGLSRVSCGDQGNLRLRRVRVPVVERIED
ncbi:hypothetical protein MCOR02_010473 [Pyricularia oryzae]|uniref:Uncharacterized protein n=1 Tax=Pyricularia oryzae TaxID=318829 RepID=A0A4P7NNM1_PYROR|nr:hypothetical protein MCOR02_010473 [Pyricularia oryzae]KAI6305912.1 hypothetical protein MCOR34_008296 [Pyricularia oryzae]KAI6470983.1 hypothetical protein MCOR17_003353 [Pyricularia oryzae]KAI6510886.1 hypothetical protein MCOR13_000810 [Pyricularia oryzae]KAI6563967.1 hypothetical protein MCOR09_007286 [Pyricularia oryzae]